MVRQPSPELVEASRGFVCVRVTDMAGVDLSTYVFDYDLTFAVLLMHADGHVYRQYGNRTPAAHDSHLSQASLVAAMRGTLDDHAERAASLGAKHTRPSPPADGATTIETLPAMAERIAAGKAPECFHCHMVFQARDEEAAEKGAFGQADVWRWPPSTRIGLTLDRDDQRRVVAVADGSPAAVARLRAGDRLVRLGGRVVRTEGDVQWVLDGIPGSGASLLVEFLRDDEEAETEVHLPDGWRAGTPEELWRASMWRLDPKPGFGGPMLGAREKERLGIDADVAAFRVKYVVTWGKDARTGRNAQKAGLRKGDVVLSVGGRSDFRSPQHFHAWFRLTRKAGETVPIEILRDGERRTIDLTVLD